MLLGMGRREWEAHNPMLSRRFCLLRTPNLKSTIAFSLEELLGKEEKGHRACLGKYLLLQKDLEI